MKESDLIKVHRRRIAEAQAEQARWQAKIDAAPPGTGNHQLGVWRGKVRDGRQQEQAARARLERLEEE